MIKNTIAKKLEDRMIELYAERNEKFEEMFKEEVNNCIINCKEPLQIVYCEDDFGNTVEIYIDIEKLEVKKFNSYYGNLIVRFENEKDLLEHIELVINEDIPNWIETNNWVKSNKTVTIHEDLEE